MEHKWWLCKPIIHRSDKSHHFQLYFKLQFTLFDEVSMNLVVADVIQKSASILTKSFGACTCPAAMNRLRFPGSNHQELVLKLGKFKGWL